MKDTILSERLARAGRIADERLNRMDKIVTSRSPGPSLHEYLPQALQRAQVDPDFALQLKESLDRYAIMHRAVWGKRDKT